MGQVRTESPRDSRSIQPGRQPWICADEQIIVEVQKLERNGLREHNERH